MSENLHSLDVLNLLHWKKKKKKGKTETYGFKGILKKSPSMLCVLKVM